MIGAYTTLQADTGLCNEVLHGGRKLLAGLGDLSGKRRHFKINYRSSHD